MQIDVVSDVVCPWCYIGKRQLESAIEQFKKLNPNAPEPTVVFRPFQLNPTMPPSGMARRDYLFQKFGTHDGGNIYQRVLMAAEQVGLQLNISRIARQPNTLKAHALINAAIADTSNCHLALNEALFQAYFIEGLDLTDDEVLKSVASQAGLKDATVSQTINDPAVHQEIAQQDQHARQLGITGVPFFIFNQRSTVSGAAGAPALLQAMQMQNDDLKKA